MGQRGSKQVRTTFEEEGTNTGSECTSTSSGLSIPTTETAPVGRPTDTFRSSTTVRIRPRMASPKHTGSISTLLITQTNLDIDGQTKDRAGEKQLKTTLGEEGTNTGSGYTSTSSQHTLGNKE